MYLAVLGLKRNPEETKMICSSLLQELGVKIEP